MIRLLFTSRVLLTAFGTNVQAESPESRHDALAALHELNPIVKVDEAELRRPAVAIRGTLSKGVSRW
jgi:hypothetical protein